MNERPAPVRCIFGSTIQRQAEAAGMTEYCDEHCHKASAWAGTRGHECPRELAKYGISVK